jgi:hypothetical protein
MFSFKINLSIVLLAIWLVILQVLSPFVHAHIDTGDHSDQLSGLHLHAADVNVLDQVFNHGEHHWSESDSALDTHIVVVEKGLNQKLGLSDIVMVLIVAFVFYALQSVQSRLRPQQQCNLRSTCLRGHINPRAPPYC